jgi:hypothetical protein
MHDSVQTRPSDRRQQGIPDCVRSGKEAAERIAARYF